MRKDEFDKAMTRILQTNDGKVLKSELEWFVSKTMYHSNPTIVAYQAGKHDLATYLLGLAQPEEEI